MGKEVFEFKKLLLNRYSCMRLYTMVKREYYHSTNVMETLPDSENLKNGKRLFHNSHAGLVQSLLE